MFTKLTPQWWLGTLIGLLMPLFGIAIILEARPELLGIQRISEQELIKQINVQIITLGMIINAALFFVFLRFQKEEVSRGILFVSVIYLIGIFIYRFLL
jgi:uncharacterized membrane protein